jgi:hypothetical protein
MRMRFTLSVVLATTLLVVGLAVAQDTPLKKGEEKKTLSSPNDALSKLTGTRWTGTGELWLDKLGNEAHRCECSLTVDPAAVGSFSYTWSHEGKAQTGSLVLRDGGAVWTDTFHQPTPKKCSLVADSWALLAAHYTFSVGGGPDWGWRLALAQRPTGELVLQMTVIKPWGEENRAVRMVFTRSP